MFFLSGCKYLTFPLAAVASACVGAQGNELCWIIIPSLGQETADWWTDRIQGIVRTAFPTRHFTCKEGNLLPFLEVVLKTVAWSWFKINIKCIFIVQSPSI